MQLDALHFTPWLSLAGGVLIGLAAAWLMAFNGRIAGISGIVGSLFTAGAAERGWRAAFVAGLIAAPLLMRVAGAAVTPQVDAGWGELLAAGLLVGIGTRYAGGCTSGHGVCGLSRGATRSIVATAVFMVAGFATVFVQRHVLGG
ncbi:MULTISPECIES: YeeE/YedE family protein [unclassified Burkholderia]|uniref:YeeE/YedE family protein n=1 Tax=unclassified Burkholderia TaxID=2613784 RepID=UPI0005CF4C7E|nr:MULTISPECIES: YeeE/YedE family protein [unclassified Burkholderia]MCR4466950.1 YeeE/YedE family protein [Burkholderia sp. SCN-KJ]RQR47017.1 YeeE/YedE family protein [Burkholderia sp. Bp9131]RQR79903.1 YeeE/YedE family protein [Burkholderia sp. Bp9015]RQS01676.1 YeeE/YedE family protein [Burkholderia sp. Bp8994]RQS35075.1 YeeE/YedE family protein [Burkholderia sp. Bp8995]